MNKARIFERLEERARDYGLHRLSKASGISRQGIYRLLTEKNPQFDTLEKIATTLHMKVDLTGAVLNTNDIYSSLRFHDAPLSARPARHYLSLEETIAQGIALSRTDGFICSMIPYVLFKNADKIEASHLIGLCDSLGEGRALGYYADIANTFKPNKRMKLLAEVLFNLDFNEEAFFKDSENQSSSYRKLAALTDNPIAKKWKFQTIDGLSEHLERYQKWLKQK